MEESTILHKLLTFLKKHGVKSLDLELNSKKDIFLYKLLLSLKSQGIKEIDTDALYNKYYVFNELLQGYKLNDYTFQSADKFITELLLVFIDFEMGIYNPDYKLYFYEEETIEEKIYKFPLKDVSDNLINEIAKLLSFELNNYNKEKQLIKN